MAETTEDQQKYEELFAHRFSSEDREYQQYLSRPPDPPPIVEGWRSRGGGGNHRGRDNRYQDRRGWEGDRSWRGHHRREQDRHDRDQDRYGGHGSGYQSGPPHSNHGYNSYHQRRHYDRY